MNSIYDYQRFAILYVDDEEKSLKYFARAFGDKFRIFTAPNAADGFKLLEDHQEEIGVIMSDQRMPGQKGVQFLEQARQLRPRVIRILATAYSDLDAAIDAVNSGAIYKYVTKPWDLPVLETTLRRSLEFFIVQTERDQLLAEKLSVVQKMLITDRVLSLGVLAAGLGRQLRNTLDAVRAFLELAPELVRRESLDLAQLRHPAFWQEFHRNVESRVKRILTLVGDDAGASGPPASFDTEARLDVAINEAIAGVRPDLDRRRIQVDNLVPPVLPALRVDSPRFGRLFTLLLRLELENLQEGGMVRIEAAPQTNSVGETTELAVYISDDGPGLPQEAILSMFDPFVIRKEEPQEFGVLLAAAFFLVHHHGGRITVRPGGGRGMALAITLPLDPRSVGPGDDSGQFLARVMTNERLWERLLGGI